MLIFHYQNLIFPTFVVSDNRIWYAVKREQASEESGERRTWPHLVHSLAVIVGCTITDDLFRARTRTNKATPPTNKATHHSILNFSSHIIMFGLRPCCSHKKISYNQLYYLYYYCYFCFFRKNAI